MKGTIERSLYIYLYWLLIIKHKFLVCWKVMYYWKKLEWMQPIPMPMLLLQQGCQVKRCKQDIYYFLFLNKPLYSKNHKPMPNLMVSTFFNCYLLSLFRRRISFIYNWCHIWPPWSNLTSRTLRNLQIHLRPETELNSLDCHVLWIRRISN